MSVVVVNEIARDAGSFWSPHNLTQAQPLSSATDFREERPKLLDHHAKGTSQSDFEQNFQDAFAGGTSNESKALFKAASRTIANRWKAMTAAEKSPYEEKAALLTQQYRKKLEEYEGYMVESMLEAEETKIATAASTETTSEPVPNDGKATMQDSVALGASASKNRAIPPPAGPLLLNNATASLGIPMAVAQQHSLALAPVVDAPVSYVLPPGYPLEALPLPPLALVDPTVPHGRTLFGPSAEVLTDHFVASQALEQQRTPESALVAQDEAMRQLALQQLQALRSQAPPPPPPAAQAFLVPHVVPPPTQPPSGPSLWGYAAANPRPAISTATAAEIERIRVLYHEEDMIRRNRDAS